MSSESFMNKIFAFFLLAFFVLGCAQPQQGSGKPVLTIYASMVSEYGLGPKVVPLFEQKCGCLVNMVSKGDAGQLLSVLVLEKDSPKADLVIGLDNTLYAKAVNAGILEKFTPKNISLVPKNLRLDSDGYLTSFDFGYIAFVYDSQKIQQKLESFDSLLSPELSKKIVIENPKTSSPGMALLLWSVKVFGDPGYKEFWKKFKSNVLTVTDGWDQAAGLFEAGEAPIYLSYATSPAYYAGDANKPNFVGAKFREGHYIQIEGMGIVSGAKNRALAEQFIEFSLEPQFQQEIPLSQYMFPVNADARLPASFGFAVKPDKSLELDRKIVEEKQEEWVSEWEKIMAAGS